MSDQTPHRPAATRHQHHCGWSDIPPQAVGGGAARGPAAAAVSPSFSSRDVASHPEVGDRVRLRNNVIARVVQVFDLSVQYRIEQLPGANAVVINRQGWYAMTRGCAVLSFDPVDDVR